MKPDADWVLCVQKNRYRRIQLYLFTPQPDRYFLWLHAEHI